MPRNPLHTNNFGYPECLKQRKCPESGKSLGNKVLCHHATNHNIHREQRLKKPPALPFVHANRFPPKKPRRMRTEIRILKVVLSQKHTIKKTYDRESMKPIIIDPQSKPFFKRIKALGEKKWPKQNSSHFSHKFKSAT